MKQKIKEFLRLARIYNALIAILVVFIGVKVASGYIPLLKTLLLSFSIFFLNIFANVQNDIVDIETDRGNNKHRPLVEGTIKENEAGYLAISALLISLVFAYFCGLAVFITTLLLAILIYLYNISLKRIILVSNLTVSFILSMVFILSGMLVHSIKYAIPPALIAFYYNFLREIIKDWADIEGDRITNRNTIPMMLGNKLTLALILILSLFFIPFLIIPFLGGIYGKAYLYTSVAFCGVPLFVSIILLKKNKEDLIMLSKITKVLMIPLLLAIYLGV